MMFRTSIFSLMFTAALLAAGPPGMAAWEQRDGPPGTVAWDSAAQYRQFLHGPVAGTLVFGETGIAFQSPKFSQRWNWQEIQTFDLRGARELTIQDYESRRWHEPGKRRFRFVLAQPMPPQIARSLAARVARPSINGDPVKDAPAIAEIPAHRRERIGGSNGTIRFRREGIDYVAANARDSSSWRWSDIQTIANPNEWEFRVTAYREIVEFDLKKPLSRELFDRLWNILYAAELNVAPGKESGQ
jgi:hypothetical protein